MKKMKFLKAVIFLMLGLFAYDVSGQGWVRKYEQGSSSLNLLSNEDGSVWQLTQSQNANKLKKIGEDGVLQLNEDKRYSWSFLSRFENQDLVIFNLFGQIQGNFIQNELSRYKINQNGETIDSTLIAFNNSEFVVDAEQISTIENNFISLIQYKDSTGLHFDSVFLMKYSNTGNLLWKKFILRNDLALLLLSDYGDLKVANDNSIYAYVADTLSNYPRVICHFESNGTLISKHKGNLVEIASDASLFFTTQNQDSIFIHHYDSNGQFLWKNGYKIQNNQLLQINETQDNGLFVSSFDSYTKKKYFKLSSNGQTLWLNQYGETSYGSIGKQYIENDKQGNIYHVEVLDKNTILPDLGPRFLRIIKFNSAGQLIYRTITQFSDYRVTDIKPGINGNLFISYYENFNFFGDTTSNPRACLINIDSFGSIFSNRISGKIATDVNNNCLVDSLEIGLKNKIITAKTSDGIAFYALSDSIGNYEIGLDTGQYNLKIQLQSPYQDPCVDEILVDLIQSPQSIQVDFPIQETVSCPLLEVNIASESMRRCFQNRYYIQYCNIGTAAAPNAQVSINLSDDVQFISSSLPGLNTGGHTWQFSIGLVEIGECGSFTLDFLVICNSTVLGQSICSTAHITPDSICTPPNTQWSGAQVMVDGACEGDSVRFSIKNIGNGNMTAAQDFIVIEDNIILREGNFNLAPLDSLIIRTPANGSTWRLEAGQEPTFPVSTMPAVSVEGCGQNLGGLFSLGFVTQFGEDDGNPFYSRSCQVIVGSYDPNDKSALPKGVAEAHIIYPNTPIDYQIRFQNTGTDTAFTVIIRDTLADWMERTSFEPGPSSFPYQVAMQGHGILKFTFDNIRLPDSLVNEANSHGFVNYRLTPKNSTPLGTVIENRAGIYFDFNAPVMTNTVFHTIDTGFLDRNIQEVKTVELIDNQSIVRVLPNPVRAGSYLFFEKNDLEQNWFSIFDGLGKNVFQNQFSGNKIRLPEHLKEGNYFFELKNEKGKTNHGRFVVF
jgi:hypothetical protein